MPPQARLRQHPDDLDKPPRWGATEHLLARLIYVTSVASVEGQGFKKPIEVNEPTYDTAGDQQVTAQQQRRGGHRVAGQHREAYSGAIDRMLQVRPPGGPR